MSIVCLRVTGSFIKFKREDKELCLSSCMFVWLGEKGDRKDDVDGDRGFVDRSGVWTIYLLSYQPPKTTTTRPFSLSE